MCGQFNARRIRALLDGHRRQARPEDVRRVQGHQSAVCTPSNGALALCSPAHVACYFDTDADAVVLGLRASSSPARLSSRKCGRKAIRSSLVRSHVPLAVQRVSQISDSVSIFQPRRSRNGSPPFWPQRRRRWSMAAALSRRSSDCRALRTRRCRCGGRAPARVLGRRKCVRIEF